MKCKDSTYLVFRKIQDTYMSNVLLWQLGWQWTYMKQKEWNSSLQSINVVYQIWCCKSRSNNREHSWRPLLAFCFNQHNWVSVVKQYQVTTVTGFITQTTVFKTWLPQNFKCGEVSLQTQICHLKQKSNSQTTPCFP